MSRFWILHAHFLILTFRCSLKVNLTNPFNSLKINNVHHNVVRHKAFKINQINNNYLYIYLMHVIMSANVNFTISFKLQIYICCNYIVL